MKNYYFTLLLLTATLNVAAQTYKLENNRPIEIPEFNDPVQLSGMAQKADLMYFSCEKIPYIYTRNIAGLLNKITLSYQRHEQDVEIEGITFLNNQLLMVSENVPGIYLVNEETNKAIKLKTGAFIFRQFTRDGDGLEGIAGNGTDLLYVLQERVTEVKKTYALIYTFRYKKTLNELVPHLEWFATDTINLPNSDWRYSDICFDSKLNKLMCLKSSYGSYDIDMIDIGLNGKLKRASLKPMGLGPVLNKIHEAYKDNFATNFEGLVKDGDTIYIVSDNYLGEYKNGKRVKKTMYLKLVNQ